MGWEEYAFVIGFTLLFIGVILVFLGALAGVVRQGEGKVEVGGVVMIGPIPIAFGSSSKALLAAMVLAVALMVMAILFYWKLLKAIPT